MKLSFTSDGEGDILNATIQDLDTGSVMYTAETPKRAGGTLTTTVTRWNPMDGSTELVFRILWKGTGKSLGDVRVVSDFRTLQEIPVREVLGSAPGVTTYGSVRISDTDYRWKSKGTGSKVVLVNKDTNATVAQSHSRIRRSIFRKSRDMSLEISQAVSNAVDLVLLTFILVWKERQSERSKSMDMVYQAYTSAPITPLGD